MAAPAESAAATPRRLDPAQLARLGSLAIKARVIVEGALTGLHRASLHGASVEFAEHKEYSPGDELRHVDWKAYAKQDRYYVKQFEQESQLPVYLVLDGSASMAFAGSAGGAGGGGISKLEYGALALAAVAHLVIHQQDKCGLIATGDRAGDHPALPVGGAAGRGRAATGETVVPPRARASHLHDVLAVLDAVIARGGRGDESPAHALARIAEMSRRRRTLVVIASDLFDASGETLAALAALRAQRHDVSVLHVLAPDERGFPYDGLTQFEPLEGGAAMLVNPQAIRREYLARMDAFLADVRGRCDRAGVDYHLVSTDRPLEDTLLGLLVARSRLLPGGRGAR